MHKSRYHVADYLLEIFSPFTLNVSPDYLHISLYSFTYLLDGFGNTQFLKNDFNLYPDKYKLSIEKN